VERKKPEIRRVVTGHDATGKPIVWMDGPASVHQFPNEYRSSTILWVTDETPADFTVDKDPAPDFVGTPPPEGGTRFSIFEIKPGGGTVPQVRAGTDTIDYIVCLSGEMTLFLADSRVTLKAGDTLIQRGTHHGWVNLGDVPARLAIVMVDGKPKRPGSIQRGKRAL